MAYQVTLIIQNAEDYTFTASDEGFEDNFQDMLVEACEEADIDTHDVINVLSEHVPNEDQPFAKKRHSNKYVEVSVNFPGNTIAEDETWRFCINGASEHKAAETARDIVEEQGHWRYSGYGSAVRKDKRS